MGKTEDKKEIFEAVKRYYKDYHEKKASYNKGDPIAYAGRVYDENEIINLVDSALDFWLTAGDYTDEFEKRLGDFLGLDYVSMVNSGSSANLLAISALTSPLLKDRQLKKGDEVITVAAGFPTTINPILQNGLVPVFVDVTIPQYNIDASQLEKAYSKKTKAVIMAHTLGNPFNIKAVKEFCDEKGMWLIEDNCDALGSLYNGRYTGTFGDIGTSSFYPAHHITTGEGGAAYTNNPLLHKIIRSLRDWGRDCICPPGEDDTCKNRFNGSHGTLPEGYDHKYVYSHAGYNLKTTDMQAAIGVAQLEKLPKFIKARKENFDYLKKKLKDSGLEDKMILPEAEAGSEPAWFGFLITLKEGVDREEIVKALENAGIQTRMLFAGNIIDQPYFKGLKEGKDFRIASSLEKTKRIMENSFWLGVYPGMTREMLDYMAEALFKAVKQAKK